MHITSLISVAGVSVSRLRRRTIKTAACYLFPNKDVGSVSNSESHGAWCASAMRLALLAISFVFIQSIQAQGSLGILTTVWRQGTWFTLSSNGNSYNRGWGLPGDIPVPGDYDGDGQIDFAVWRPSEGNWYIIESSTGATRTQGFGVQGDYPRPR
jgi:hypothetical protein